MARPNFFNENMGRTFPFLEDFQEIQEELAESISLSMSGGIIYDMQLLPNDAIVDFGCNIGIRAAYDPDAHIVYLAEVRRQQSNFVFEFRCTSPDLADRILLFSRPIADTDYATEYNESVNVGLEFSQSLSECGDDSDWDGYLSTGTMETLATILTAEGDKLKGDEAVAIVEPALIRSLQGTFIRSISLANADRTRAENPSGCPELAWPFTIQPVYIARECLTGPIRIVEGYNTEVDQSDVDNSLTINAALGGGAGEPCVEVPVFPSEAPAIGDSVLTGGPKCNEVIRSINGVGGRVLDVLSGAGVSITSDPDNSRIYVDFDMNNLALCFDGETVDEYDCSESSTSQSVST